MANTLLYQLSDYIGYDILMQYLQELIQQARIMLGSSNYPEPAIEQLHNSLNQASQNIAVLQSRVQINQSALMVVDRQMSYMRQQLSSRLLERYQSNYKFREPVPDGRNLCHHRRGLFQDSLNAVAAFTMSSNWAAMLYMATVLSITVAAVAYTRTHDLTTMLKWVVAFVMVSGVLLGSNARYRSLTSQTLPGFYQVDNVPVGLVLPASLISTIGHGVVVAYETVFHRPDALTYNKTGMLFGASLVGGSTDFASTDPIIASLFSDYVQNCVVGDMMLNHKYSLEELMRSEDPMR